jgi:DNA excision repair protein ERCC-4
MEFTISQNSLQSRIALLLLHFPKLRVIWSRSLHATADIFLALKTKQVPPSPPAMMCPPFSSSFDNVDDET